MEGGVATFVEEGVTKLADPTYEKSWGDIALDTGNDAFIGGAIGFVFNGFCFGDEGVDTVKNTANKLTETINTPALQWKLASQSSYYVNFLYTGCMNVHNRIQILKGSIIKLRM